MDMHWEATAQGNVFLEMRLSPGKIKRCISHNVLYEHKHAYNLLSITKASEVDHAGCQIVNKSNKLATKVGTL